MTLDDSIRSIIKYLEAEAVDLDNWICNNPQSYGVAQKQDKLDLIYAILKKLNHAMWDAGYII